MSCRTVRDSQINIVLTAICQIFVILLFLALGVLLYLYIDFAGLQMPSRGDDVFAMVAVQGGLPLIVGIVFIIGLISSTYSAAGSALTSLTTSFSLDILDASKFDNERLTKIRKYTHIAMAIVITLVILVFHYLATDSVINLVFKVAGYTYGPILGLFTFGIPSKRGVRQRYVPIVAILSPLLSYLLQWVAAAKFGYHIGFELLGYNALFTIFGLIIISQKKNDKVS